MLGVGDFYYEIAVQVIELCIQTRSINGGLMDMNDVLERLRKKRGAQAKVVSMFVFSLPSLHPLVLKCVLLSDDITRAVTKLKTIGSGFEILRIGSRSMLQSIPMELSNDHSTVLLFAQEKGFVTYSIIMRELGWSKDRIDVVIVRVPDCLIHTKSV